jgi:hypothetical protein
VDRRQAAVIIDKTKLLELIHEMTDPRPGGADHLCQVFPIDSGTYSFGSTILAKMSQQQENSSQTLLAGVEKVVDDIPFESDIARKQMCDEQFRDIVLFVQRAHHQRLRDPGQMASGHCGSRSDAHGLTCEASLAEELPGTQNGDNRFLALVG